MYKMKTSSIIYPIYLNDVSHCLRVRLSLTTKKTSLTSLSFLPNCQQNCQNSPLQVLTDTTGKKKAFLNWYLLEPESDLRLKSNQRHMNWNQRFSPCGCIFCKQLIWLLVWAAQTEDEFPLMCTKTGMSEHCGWCGGGLATFSQGLSGRADERSAGSRDGLVGSVGFQLHLFWGVQGLLVPPMVAENCLSRNLKPEAERGKKKEL